jgi:SAM-dependent methyltransferase
MFARLKSSIREQDFNPGGLGLLVNPFYFARKGLHRHIVALAPLVRGRILDVGCGSKPYRKYFNASEYIGLEIEGRNKDADRLYDGKEFPFKDGEFDSVFTSQVLEHVFNPEEFLLEINRVLKDGGVLLLTVPFIWDEHEQPFDYARYSSFGLRHLLESHGFEIVDHRKSMSDIRVIFQMINAYIYKKTITRSARLNLLLTLILMAPFNLLGEFFAKILPGNNDLYLDNIVLARKKQHLGQAVVGKGD